MSRAPELMSRILEEFKASMKWNPDTSDEVKNAVISNVNGFAGFLLQKQYLDNLMTMRDQFIMAAIEGSLSSCAGNDVSLPAPEATAKYACEVADAVLIERLK